MSDPAASRRARTAAALAAVLLLVADQASKAVLLEVMAGRGWQPLELTPFFSLVMVWNRGVSFGIGGGGVMPPWAWVVLSLVIVALLLAWLRRLERPWIAAAIGAVIGGAIGNVIDRLRFGAVADFFDFHLAGWHWPAFNIADAGIVVGVAVLMLDTLFSRESRASHAQD